MSTNDAHFGLREQIRFFSCDFKDYLKDNLKGEKMNFFLTSLVVAAFGGITSSIAGSVMIEPDKIDGGFSNSHRIEQRSFQAEDSTLIVVRDDGTRIEALVSTPPQENKNPRLMNIGHDPEKINQLVGEAIETLEAVEKIQNHPQPASRLLSSFGMTQDVTAYGQEKYKLDSVAVRVYQNNSLIDLRSTEEIAKEVSMQKDFWQSAQRKIELGQILPAPRLEDLAKTHTQAVSDVSTNGAIVGFALPTIGLFACAFASAGASTRREYRWRREFPQRDASFT